MPLKSSSSETAAAVQTLSRDLIHELRRRFPVCLASDEFHFFPQVAPDRDDLERWDDFSPSAVADIVSQGSFYSRQLSRLAHSRPDPQTQIDIRLLQWVLAILTEQMENVRPQNTQPTFYLTIAGIGLAQAYGHGPQAWRRRLEGLPRFLESAQANLETMPHLFCARGQAMAANLKAWLEILSPISNSQVLVKAAIVALDRFQDHLAKTAVTKEFRLSPELYARVIHTHIGSGLTLAAAAEELDRELDETERILTREGPPRERGQSWQDVHVDPPAVHSSKSEVYRLYRKAITDLENHCIGQGLVARDQARTCPVTVAAVPSYLIPVRSAAAYSMEPGHPPRGGTFYLMPDDSNQQPAADMHLLCAHETYPGHHLLDTARWNLTRPLRRHLEFPLFYEGWASFAEELLFETGYCSGSRERFLMARRRYYRALRGKVDLMLNQGAWRRTETLDYLRRAGYPIKVAEGMLVRYALKPGYQLCYTLGRQRFSSLYKKWIQQNGTLKDFCRKVLSTGEIHLTDLEQQLTP